MEHRAARLEFDLAHVSVRRGRHWALRDVSLALTPAHCFALLGANGAGKTQLLKLLATDVWPTPTGRETLGFRLGRRELVPAEAKAYVAYVGAELQDKYARYDWNLGVADLVATGLHGTDLLHAAVTRGEHARVRAMLRACGLGALAGRAFLSLSYGQKRIALLARALVRRPHWLLLDEFYNGLDRQYRRRIDRLLAAARKRGQAWIAAAHRREDIPSGTTRVIALENGRLQAVTTLRRTLRDAAPAPVPEAAGGTLPGAVASAAAAPLPIGARVLIRLVAVDLYVDYRRVLGDVNWELRAGEHWAVVGANGAGKSSFLKLLYGDLSPALGGCIERAAFPSGTPIERWKRRVGYVSPELQTDYCIDVTLVELVASGRHASIGLNEPPTAGDRRAALRWLEFFDLRALAAARPRELSYGQMRRALLARALVGNPQILLLDEPLTGLDRVQHAGIRRLLERLMCRGVALVIAVHHAADLPAGVERVLRLHRRRAESLAAGRAREFLGRGSATDRVRDGI